MKIINKIKEYRPPKYIRYLSFFIPFLVVVFFSPDNDIWFLLNHGKYVISNGIPTIEPFSLHQGFSFVMQQWLTSVVFYSVYSVFKQYGLIILVIITLALFMYFVYKLCLLVSNNQKYLSTIITVLTSTMVSVFFKTRPQIFTYLLLIIILYILELYRKDKKTKAIYFLPFISLLEINLHASMWFMIYLFILPYFLYFIYTYYTNKDQKIIKLVIIIILMILSGFINPYGLKAITYVFKSYGNYYINNLVYEMRPPSFDDSMGIYILFSIELLLFILVIYKKRKLDFIYTCLLLGTLILSLKNYRSFPLFVIATYPFLGYYLKGRLKDKPELKMKNIVKNSFIGTSIFLTIYLIILVIIKQINFSNQLKSGADILVKKDNITLFCNYESGGYLEFRGLKPYIDPRAEVFLKTNNQKEDVLKEYYLVERGMIDYDKFISKYNFTHLVIRKKQYHLLKYIKSSQNYHLIWSNKEYFIYEKNN